tara:strand:+ start:106 stop:252 length:147 start_codon:yes stop_codon:yes gene_type:complete
MKAKAEAQASAGGLKAPEEKPMARAVSPRVELKAPKERAANASISPAR